VVVESPPYFHPEQVAAVVEAGKHLFLAKPVAVDVSGCLSILASAEKAKGKLSVLVDFQTRARPAFQEAVARVQRGEIGTPIMGHVFYHVGRLKRQDQPGMSAAEARLRNWSFDKALSGDVIVEQHIHAIDVATWYLDAHPVKAFGTGGRKARVDVGDAWDHFLVTFWFPNDLKVDFSSNQFIKGFYDMCIRYYGTAGTVDSHYNGAVRITGETNWLGTEKDPTFDQGAITNVRNFVESVRSGKLLNNAADAVRSNLTCILGRMAAYGERVVTWDEMMASNERLDPRLPPV
jgi:predicted dehydrogenase